MLCALAASAQPQPEGIERPAAIRAAARKFVEAQLAHSAGISSLEVGALDDRLRLTRCARALHAQLPPGMTVQGRSTVGVGCDSPVHWMIYVPVTVERQIPVLVLRHPVQRGSLVTVADVGVEKRRIEGLGAAYLQSPAELEGRALRGTLAAGTTLTVEMFAPEAVVHRGQQVTLLAGSADIQVRALGRALEDAAAGARLKVENLSSLQVVEGVAQSSGIVRISP
jgi:flagellar basal body P-ring formation protein FlgA